MNIDTKLFDWIGGKKWLCGKLNDRFTDILNNNENIKYYAEPFCGSLGSLIGAIETLKNNNIEKIYLNDINNTIINTFNFVKNDPDNLFEEYCKIESGHIKLMPEKCFGLNKTKDKLELKILMKDSQEYYNKMRVVFNSIKNDSTKSLEASSIFLFLMSRSFNGIYRENSKGNFNSPYCWTPKKVNFENKKNTILNFNRFFNDMKIEFSNMSCFDFLDKMESQKNDTLFYFDPPYLNKDIKENNYSKDSFGLKEQNRLLDYIKGYNHIVYSNHNLDIFQNFFSNSKYSKDIVYRKNNMSSDNNNRANDVAEILAYTK